MKRVGAGRLVSTRLPVTGNERLRRAHVNGQLPPWLIDGREWYAYLGPVSSPPHPAKAMKLVGRGIKVLDLVGVEPPRDVTEAGSAVGAVMRRDTGKPH